MLTITGCFEVSSSLVSGLPNFSRKMWQRCPHEAILLTIYQHCVETCADLSAGVVVRRDARVIHEKSVPSVRTLTNAAAENDLH